MAQDLKSHYDAYQHYLNLPQPEDSVLVTYVWIDGSGENLRQKTKTYYSEPLSPEDCCDWNFDGSSTNQASGINSDVYIKPVALFKDPFRLGKNKIVLCETYDHEYKPHKSNKRHTCKNVMDQAKNDHPWFGIEQEYVMLDKDYHPLGWPKGGYLAPQGPYYCGVGADKVYGRHIIEAHYKACLYSGIKIAGTNAEVMPSQWEYQIGPCEGIEMGDQLWMARFFLLQIAEEFDVIISLDPKPKTGPWNGSGAHCNFSTAIMREEGGIDHIQKAIQKLQTVHLEHMKVYDPNNGEDNKRRLLGTCETARWDEFKSGVANRGASIRIPRNVYQDQKGYLEDRRPASNCDPYSVTQKIVENVCLK